MTRTDTPLAAKPPVRAGIAEGAVRVILRLEGLALLAAACTAYGLLPYGLLPYGLLPYGLLHGGWGRFALLFFLPDLSMLGYLAGPRVGAAVYNAGHSTLAPAALGLAGAMLAAPGVYPVALIWTAHIGFDRMMGYGLKYPAAFGDTHLGLVGRWASHPTSV